MPSKIGDLAIKIGSYQKDGQSKGRYETIGTLFAGEDGGQFITLKPYVDLGALWQMQRNEARNAGKDARDTLMVSIFTDEGRSSQPAAAKPATDFDDDIAF
jgi:hypothetical protein